MTREFQDELNKAIGSAMQRISEDFGLDSFVVCWSRFAGDFTFSGSAGAGNHYARIAMCADYVDRQKEEWLIDTREQREE